MSKIKFISDYPFSIGYGGKEIQLMTYYADYLEGSNFQVELLNYWDKNALDETVILHAFGYSTWYRSLFNNLKIKRPNIKIVLSPNFYRNDEFLYKISNKLFSKLPLRNYFSELAQMFRSVDALIFNSIEEKKQHARIFGKFRNVHVIPNGIEDNFSIIEELDAPDFDKVPKEHYALSVGFFDERKNSIKMIEAFIKTMHFHDLNLVLVGEPRFVSELNHTRFLNLLEVHKDRIISLGFVERGCPLLKKLYASCDFHILPSLFETPGISNLEALAFKKPIIVGDCAPVREYFLKNAIYCEPKSIASISQSIIEAVQNQKSFHLPNGLYYSSLAKKLIECYAEVLNVEKSC